MRNLQIKITDCFFHFNPPAKQALCDKSSLITPYTRLPLILILNSILMIALPLCQLFFA